MMILILYAWQVEKVMKFYDIKREDVVRLYFALYSYLLYTLFKKRKSGDYI